VRLLVTDKIRARALQPQRPRKVATAGSSHVTFPARPVNAQSVAAVWLNSVPSAHKTAAGVWAVGTRCRPCPLHPLPATRLPQLAHGTSFDDAGTNRGSRVRVNSCELQCQMGGPLVLGSDDNWHGN
jgi:hypothetical protein